MDIVLHDLEASAAERDAVDGVLGPPGATFEGATETAGHPHFGRGGHRARAQRHLLLPALHAVQGRVGWISPGALEYICRRLTIPPAEAYGVASFYALFSLRPQPPAVAHVCTDVACLASGAQALCAALRERFGEPGAERNGAGATWLESPCLGLCERAPAALVSVAGEHQREHQLAPAGLSGIERALDGEPPPAPPPPPVPQAGQGGLRLLRRVGRVDPESIDDYRAHGGFAALRAAVDLGPERVLRELADSGLLGRGGAAFPTGRKWEAVARSPRRPHYLVCNADESEPGTFKDRVLLEHDPFAVIEAMTIAGLTCGCERGYLYLRGEYPLAHERLAGAIAQAREHGYLGEEILGGQLGFEIELRKGAGAYICGEETALFNSIEGYRGEPRNKPPFPTEAGLFGRPTVVNNVETLVNVLDIVTEGGARYAQIGTGSSTGTRLFCLSGALSRPGLYEVAMGTRLGELLELAGGVRDGARLEAVLLGGAAGRFVGPDELDVALSFEDTRARGLTMGSGVVVAFDDSCDMVAILRRIAAFFRDESCGQCVPCRVGTVRQEEALARLANGRPRGTVAEELGLLEEIAAGMRDSSICGLGQTAADAISSALERFPLFGNRGGGR
jgi:NADH-quinone oxidoreductase subunit F